MIDNITREDDDLIAEMMSKTEETMSISEVLEGLKEYDGQFPGERWFADAYKAVAVLEADFNDSCDRIDELEKTLRDCRNELCIKCGRYRERHLGACDGCRWKDV